VKVFSKWVVIAENAQKSAYVIWSSGAVQQDCVTSLLMVRVGNSLDFPCRNGNTNSVHEGSTIYFARKNTNKRWSTEMSSGIKRFVARWELAADRHVVCPDSVSPGGVLSYSASPFQDTDCWIPHEQQQTISVRCNVQTEHTFYSSIHHVCTCTAFAQRPSNLDSSDRRELDLILVSLLYLCM
jgi:hypothetical protein